MPVAKPVKALLRLAAFEVAFEHRFECRAERFEGDSTEDLATDLAVLSKAAADGDVVAFAAFGFHLGAKQSDVAHEVLSAGVSAPREVDVDRLVELHSLVEVVHHGNGVTLGIRGGELAVFAAGAGDEAVAKVRGLTRET